MNLPNILTITRVFLIPIFLFVLFVRVFPHPYGQYLAALIFIVAAITDGLDGYLARSRRQISRFGKFMDPVADKLLISSALISLLALGKIQFLPVIIIISREIAVSGLRSMAASDGNIIVASRWGKYKTISQVIAITALLVNDLYPFDLISPVDQVALWIAVVLTIFSGLEYFYRYKSTIIRDGEVL
ncbi:MAG: CDP-diacylglycerol--glycerol-3-phosphate 3-phosphatidyltransferase [Firmicutes bacterium]|nr:CDP-diacylglycerol--glycerol-3-phosphate 3-phosphatidyltransferase [Bacillota bacterium]